MAFWNELPLVGGLMGGIFGNPEQEAHENALKKATQQMFQYRPELMDARVNSMGMMSHAFEPMNNALGQAYGPQAQLDIKSMVGKPFSQQAQTRMRQMATPPPKPLPNAAQMGYGSTSPNSQPGQLQINPATGYPV